MEPHPGQILAGKYKLVSKLGQGGMGAVFRAEHLALGSAVAIKIIDPSRTSEPEARARFVREAKAAASLRSPHVVQVLDYGVEGELPFIVMELMEGESLGDRLERVGRLTPDATARILSDVCRAMARAHEMGIVHRDLKPPNVFLVRNDDSDIAKVLDFGIAKAPIPNLDPSSGTRTGAMLGTPYYMSPEQAAGSRTVDHRSDLWALGIMAFECLVGRPPFLCDTLGGLVLAICTSPIPIPSQLGPVPPGFDAWFARAVARNPDERFQSARDMAKSLRIVCGLEAPVGGATEVVAWPQRLGRATEAGTFSPHPGRYAPQYAASTTSGGFMTQQVEPEPQPRKRAGSLLWVGLGLVVAMGLGGSVVFWLQRQPGRSDSEGSGEPRESMPPGSSPGTPVAPPPPSSMPVLRPEESPTSADAAVPPPLPWAPPPLSLPPSGLLPSGPGKRPEANPRGRPERRPPSPQPTATPVPPKTPTPPPPPPAADPLGI